MGLPAQLLNTDRPYKSNVVLLGAPLDTGNLGVSALGTSVIQSLSEHFRPSCLSVFDFGRGERLAQGLGAANGVRVNMVGAKLTRRIWQAESYWRIRRAAISGIRANPAARSLIEADAVLDISGGDSFTDLYGRHRFESIALLKELALDLGKPLVLLPQTYGPFHDRTLRRRAEMIARKATIAWARDPRSFQVLKDLLGSCFDADRHHCGVDVAFALLPREPHPRLGEPIATWLSDRRSVETIGLNISGLMWHDPDATKQRYGFRANYREVVLGVLRALLTQSDANIILIPHVMTTGGHFESDPSANDLAMQSLLDCDQPVLRRAVQDRLVALPPVYTDPAMAKWIIGRCDWFCGTRMHATIAALSSGVPAAAIAYSDKTLGVFETCGAGAHVADPRRLDSDDVVEAVLRSWNQRMNARDLLREAVPDVVRSAARPIVMLPEQCGLQPSKPFCEVPAMQPVTLT